MRALCFLLVPALCSAPAVAQCEIVRLDPASLNQISGMAMTADMIALVGDGNQVAIYEPGPTGWLQSAAISSPGKVLFEFPNIIADSSRVLVGMTEDGPTLNAMGRVYIFDRANNWQQPYMLEASAPAGLDTFGSGMAIDGDTLIVGASMMVQDVLCGPGKADFFEFDGTDWVHSAEFQPTGQKTSMGGYGVTMDVEGDIAVIGAGMDDELLPMAGAVYVYERDAQGWREQVKLVADPPTRYDGFGSAVALEGTTLIAGTPGMNGGAGAVHVFAYQGSSWAQVQVLEASGGMPGDAFGSFLALDGDRLVVSAPLVDIAGGNQNVGAIVAFERVGGTWIEVAQVVAEDGANQARIGEYVDLVGNQVLWAGRYAYEARMHSLGVERGTSYCLSTPNSSGSAALISVEGCDSVLASQLSLRVEGAPPGEIGLFVFAADAGQTPFGNGFLCLTPPFQRLAGGIVGAAGQLELALDFTSAPANLMTPGDTWHFQAFFRDAGFGTGFGTSDAIAVLLQP